jgi:hypothetical protein
MPTVGEVWGFHTRNVIGKAEAFKHHLCVCARTHQYLLVCSHQYPDDFPLSNLECDGLEHDESYLSLSRVLFVPKLPRTATLTCQVSKEYLAALCAHVALSQVLSPIDQQKILTGLAPYI